MGNSVKSWLIRSLRIMSMLVYLCFFPQLDFFLQQTETIIQRDDSLWGTLLVGTYKFRDDHFYIILLGLFGIKSL